MQLGGFILIYWLIKVFFLGNFNFFLGSNHRYLGFSLYGSSSLAGLEKGRGVTKIKEGGGGPVIHNWENPFFNADPKIKLGSPLIFFGSTYRVLLVIGKKLPIKKL